MADYKYYAAFDLGASSGRLMLGKWDGQLLTLEEIHRFANEPVSMNGTLYWDLPRLFYEIKTGLKKSAGYPLHGIGIDTWAWTTVYLTRAGSFYPCRFITATSVR